jgi:AcrR family transcriptional regulator
MSKSRFTGEERYRQIIEKAGEVFSIKGVALTKIRDVTEACGINEALLYKYFASKDELYREAMIYCYDQAMVGFEAIGTGIPNGILALVATTRAVLRHFLGNPVLAANMWHGVAATADDPVMRQLVIDRFGRWHRFLVDLVRRGQEGGTIRPDADPDRVAWFVRGLIWCFILTVFLSDDKTVGGLMGEPEELCRVLFEQLAVDPAGLLDQCLDILKRE